MNCKPGDLAFVVKSVVGNEGKIVRCLRLLTEAEARRENWRRRPMWEVDGLLLDTDGCLEPRAADDCLRPIRDPGDDARDEALNWLPVPHKETV